MEVYERFQRGTSRAIDIQPLRRRGSSTVASTCYNDNDSVNIYRESKTD